VYLHNGWSFKKAEGSTGDDISDFDYLHQVYTYHSKRYSGRVTVPVLWDKKHHCIVNNESSEIIRMFNSEFDEITGNEDDYYPQPLRAQIDDINQRVYRSINNGVYRCGFATSQQAYDTAYKQLFDTLDDIETVLDQNRYLIGTKITEADWRLFTTLIRFDSVYHGHFKCNRQRIEDYPCIANFVRELYQWPGVAGTVDFHHIKRHYYFSHSMINPAKIVPQGPVIDYTSEHNRDRFTKSASV